MCHAKLDVIYNWCAELIMNSPSSPPLGFPLNGFRLLFAGNMGKALPSVLESAKILLSELPSVRFVFLGTGVDALPLQSMAESLGLTNVFSPCRTDERSR